MTYLEEVHSTLKISLNADSPISEITDSTEVSILNPQSKISGMWFLDGTGTLTKTVTVTDDTTDDTTGNEISVELNEDLGFDRKLKLIYKNSTYSFEFSCLLFILFTSFPFSYGDVGTSLLLIHLV